MALQVTPSPSSTQVGPCLSSSIPFHLPLVTHSPATWPYLAPLACRPPGLHPAVSLTCCSLSMSLHSENFLDTTGSRCCYFLSDLPEQHFSCFVIMHLVFSVLSALPSPPDCTLYEGKNLVSHNNGFIPGAQHCAWHTEWARLFVERIHKMTRSNTLPQ